MSNRQNERQHETSLQARQGSPMRGKKVWFITGAGRGLGIHIARAALAAGNAIVATGRNTNTVTEALGIAEDLCWPLSWTSPAQRRLRQR
jgi:D-arabinose 1-dehydrogenase-like Zn-dependent alcohol dehydrogenase